MGSYQIIYMQWLHSDCGSISFYHFLVTSSEVILEEKEEEKESEEVPAEEKKEEAPRRRPPVGGIGIMGGQMNMNLFSEMKSNKRFSTLVSCSGKIQNIDYGTSSYYRVDGMFGIFWQNSYVSFCF